MRLRHRLTLTFTTLTAASLLASFPVAQMLVAHDGTRDFDTALLHGARETRLRGSLEDGESELPEAPIHTVRYAVLYDRSGYPLLDATDSFAGAPPALETFDVEDAITARGAFVEFSLRGMPLRGVLLPAGTDRILLFALSRASIDSDLRLLTGIFSTLFVAATGLTWLVASWLGRPLSRDVDAIGATAREVVGGQLRACVPPGAGSSTETRELGRDLDHMITQLDELLTSQRAFVAHAAHELRSPLAKRLHLLERLHRIRPV